MSTQRFRSAGPMTLNNYTPEELMHLRGVCTQSYSKIKYITFNEEIGTTCGTPHLQIYAQATEKLSTIQWHSQLGPRISNIVKTIKLEKAQKYCQGFEYDPELHIYVQKEGSTGNYEEYGRPPNQGARTDLESATAEVRKRPLSELLIEGSSHDNAIMSHISAFEKLDTLCRNHEHHIASKNQHNEFLAKRTRTSWEYHLKSIVESPVHPRHIHWYVDTVGDTGKTVNAKDLYFNHNAYYCTGGKAVDIFHAYKNQPIVVFNLVASSCKETSEYLYKVLEEFKDGIFSSGKYQSCIKTFLIPHVIVFANVPPDATKMKKDRLLVHDIQALNAPPTINNTLLRL